MGMETDPIGTLTQEGGVPGEGAAAAAEVKRWRILVVDDHPILRRALRDCLHTGDLEVVGEATNGHEALEAVKRLKPDLVLMDVEMPDMDGLVALRHIKAESPGVVVVMLTAFPNEAYLIKAAVDGASGFLLKLDDDLDFGRKLKDVLDGKDAPRSDWWKAALAHVRACSPLNCPGSAAPPATLTPKELAILRAFARGRSSAETAEDEQMCGVTLRKHCTQIYQKLCVSDRMQAVLKGIREGWLSTEGPEG